MTNDKNLQPADIASAEQARQWPEALQTANRHDEILRRPSEFISRLADTRSWSLAQVRRIVEAHGCRFAIDCHSERGTTVWFELPVVFAP